MKERSYRDYMLLVLLAIAAHNYMDNIALGLLLQSIKVDLGLSDTQLGILTGFASVLLYSILGIPIARWADRGNRVTIIALSTALWSAAVAICGMTSSFLQLLMARMTVAIGEAGCVPPAHSLIADHFNRVERPKAVSIYKLGGSISLLIGYFGAGWLNELVGWRMTFVLLGLPGLALSALAWFTLREPRRIRQHSATMLDAPTPIASQPAQPRMKDVFSTLWANITFRRLLFAFAFVAFFGYGIGAWSATFFIRSFGLKSGELGTWFALIAGGGGFLGTFFGGMLATRYASSDEPLQLKAMAFLYTAFGVVSAAKYVSPNAYIAFALMAVTSIGGGAVLGPMFAIIQTLVSERMRAMSIAVLYLFANLAGMGFGSLAAGALSDAFRPVVGEESLRYALLALCPGYVWVGWFIWRASQTVVGDLERAQRSELRAAS